jgi:hypothetical protein
VTAAGGYSLRPSDSMVRFVLTCLWARAFAMVGLSGMLCVDLFVGSY